MLDLHCCAQAFSSFREWGLFSSRDVQSSHRRGSFCCRARALEHLGFSNGGTWAQESWLLGSRTQA